MTCPVRESVDLAPAERERVEIDKVIERFDHGVRSAISDDGGQDVRDRHRARIADPRWQRARTSLLADLFSIR